jgi:hypothetical protein
MLLLMLVLGTYFGGMICFAWWDAYIGFGVEFDGGTWPPLGMALCVWPLVLPFTVAAKLMSGLSEIKAGRIRKAEQRKRIRIAAEKEQKALIQQVEQEMLEEERIKYAHRR